VAAVTFAATSCFFDRRSDAEDMDRKVRAMPGVADTDMDYDKNITSGENFASVVDFAIATDAGSQGEARRVVFGVPALLQRFGRPVAVTVRTGDGPAEFETCREMSTQLSWGSPYTRLHPTKHKGHEPFLVRGLRVAV
jgi:hypothetical protein